MIRFWTVIAVLAALTAASVVPAVGLMPEGHPALILPERVVALRFAAVGTIETIAVKRGDRVAEGDPLVTLEASVERAALKIAEAKVEMLAEINAERARLELAESTYERDQELRRRDIISEQELLESRLRRDLAAASLLEAEEKQRLATLERNHARARLDLRTIRSPFSGVVSERLLDEGASSADGVILTIADLDPLHVDLVLPVSTFGEIAVGDTADVFPEAPIGGQYAAEVHTVDRVIDAGSGTYRVRLVLPNPEFRLPGGLSATVQFRSR